MGFFSRFRVSVRGGFFNLKQTIMAKTEETKTIDIQGKIDDAVQQARKADLDLIKFIENERDNLVTKMKSDLDTANETIQNLKIENGEKSQTINRLRSVIQDLQDEIKEMGSRAEV